MEEIRAIRTTVLFVSRNAVDELRSSLASVEASTDRAALEIIVVDNGSSDGSGQLDSEFPAASFLRLPKNFGHTRAFNIGIRTAKGDFVLLAEPGTGFPPTAIGQLTAALDADVTVAAVCPYPARAFRLPVPDELYAEWTGRGNLEPEVLTASDSPVAVPYVRGMPILVRRNFLAGMRYFDERLGDTGYELDVCRQIRSAGRKILVLPRVTMELPPAETRELDPLESADRLNAAAVYAGKYFGTWTGLKMRITAAFHLLGYIISFRRPGYNFHRLSAVATGGKIDGRQEA